MKVKINYIEGENGDYWLAKENAIYSDYTINVPEEAFIRWKKIMDEYDAVQDEIRKLINKHCGLEQMVAC